MRLEYRKLSQAEIDVGLSALSGWRVEGDSLVSQFSFDSYRDGVDFALDVADEAEEMDHHPEILIGYRKVTLSISTHTVHGLSPYDFELARRIGDL
jgi:4a-hydroxytetrahydrobiopterin dehydratase